MTGRDRTVPAIPESERIGRRDLKEFLARADDEDHPITRTQLRRFLGQPDGPILPEEVLELRRCPAEWGPAPFANQGNVLAVLPNGEPFVYRACGAVDTRTLKTSSGDIVLPIPAARTRRKEKLLGIGPTGLPIVYSFLLPPNSKRHSLLSMDGPLWQVCHGSEILAEGRRSPSHFAWNLQRGIAYVLEYHAQGASSSERAKVCVGSEVVEEAHGLDAEVIALCFDARGTLYRASSCDVQAVGHPETRTVLVPRDKHSFEFDELFGFVRDLVPAGDTVAMVFEHSGSTPTYCSAFNLDGSLRSDRLGAHHYSGTYGGKGAYAELPDGRIAYVATSPGTFWVVNGVAGPHFAAVSTLFEQDGVWCYHAIEREDAQRYFTMRLHAPSEEAIAAAADTRGRWH